MTDSAGAEASKTAAAPAAQTGVLLDEAALSEVRRRRAFALFQDMLVIVLIYATLMLVLGITGIVPPGRPYLYAPVLIPIITIFYNAITISRGGGCTPGMRMEGLRMQLRDGRPAPWLNAAAHALFFFLSGVLLTPLVYLIGLRSKERRFLHDRLAEVYITNTRRPDD